MRVSVKYLAGLLVSALWFESAFALPILDQSFEPAPNSPIDMKSRVGRIDDVATFQVFQSFTVDIDGILDGIDISLVKNGNPTEDVVVEIVSGATPRGPALISRTLGPAALPLLGITPSFVSINLSADAFAVSAGDFLGFRLGSLQDFPGNVDEYIALGDDQGGYAGGAGDQFYDFYDNPQSSDGEIRDYYFRTYVDNAVSAPVPEPGPISLLAAGLLGFSLMRRRCRAN